ncbi:MAG: rod shape-determining protein MreD [bacterium]
MKKLAAFILLVGLVFLLQAALMGVVSFKGGKPDFPFILLILWAWTHDWKEGLLAGFTIGLLEDIFFSPLLGLNAFALSLVGFLTSEVRERVYQENIVFILLMVGLASILTGAILSFWLTIFRLSSSFLEKIIYLTLPTSLYNTLLVFLIFLVREVYRKERIYRA